MVIRHVGAERWYREKQKKYNLHCLEESLLMVRVQHWQLSRVVAVHTKPGLPGTYDSFWREVAYPGHDQPEHYHHSYNVPWYSPIPLIYGTRHCARCNAQSGSAISKAGQPRYMRVRRWAREIWRRVFSMLKVKKKESELRKQHSEFRFPFS